jgi:3-methyladenine DNA glycosylase Tag
VITAPTLDDHLAVISRAVFQAGLNWAIITARWDAFRTAFDNFSVARVADYGDADVARLMTAEGIVHSLGKINGTIANARELLRLEKNFGTVHAYVSRFATYETLYADAHARFSYLGDLSCYYWLFRTGEPVPRFEDWMLRQERDHPRMREMVTLARASGRSPERA